MKYCSKCGAEIKDEDRYCPNCGNDTGSVDTTYDVVENGKSHADGGSDVFGILGLIFSILGGWLGLIFDIIALASSGSSEKGKKYGKIGLIIFFAWIVLFILIIIIGACISASVAANA